jgi:hypothetical protein
MAIAHAALVPAASIIGAADAMLPGAFTMDKNKRQGNSKK